MFDKYKYNQPKQEDEPRWKSKLKLSPKDKQIIINTEKKYTEEEKDILKKDTKWRVQGPQNGIKTKDKVKDQRLAKPRRWRMKKLGTPHHRKKKKNDCKADTCLWA